ncbi:MAG: DUF427 domain-containing protein [Pseudomonadales bacterium]
MSEPAPGFRRYPDHRVDIVPTEDHVRVFVGMPAGKLLLADSRRPLRVEESRHDTVWYLPLADVAREHLSATDHTTYCPFKGHARYWTITAGESPLENAVWAYPEPYQECLPLADHVAFYTDRVALEVNGDPQPGDGDGDGDG